MGQPATFIQAMLDAEASTRGQYGGNIRFDRVGSMDEYHFVVSCEGYNHQDLMDLEAKLLKLGCRYNFAAPNGIQHFDRQCGRTFTAMKAPKDFKVNR